MSCVCVCGVCGCGVWCVCVCLCVCVWCVCVVYVGVYVCVVCVCVCVCVLAQVKKYLQEEADASKARGVLKVPTFKIRTVRYNKLGRDSSGGTAIRYGLDSARIESRWWREFPHPPGRPCGPPSLL